MFSLTQLIVPVDGTEFPTLDPLLLALHDWAVKEKFILALSAAIPNVRFGRALREKLSLLRLALSRIPKLGAPTKRRS